MDVLKRILFVLLLVGLISGEVLRFDNGKGFAITFFDITVILFVGVSFLINLFQRNSLAITKVHKFALWFVGIGLVSLLLQVFQLTPYQTIVATLYAVRFLVYTLGISWSVQLFDEKFKKRLPYLLLGSSTVLAFLGLLQYVFYPYLRNLYYAGWDPHLYRVFATFLDPNFIGLFYVCGIILGIYLLFEKSRHGFRLYQAGLGLVTLINICALFLTYSRGAYMAFLIGLCIMLWRSGYKKFILAALGMMILLVIGVELVSPHSEGTKLFRTASIRDRTISLQQVTTIISHHPFLGVGFDAYRYAQEREGFLTTKVDTTHSGAGTDNSFLFAFATTGIAGLLAYLLMTYNILKTSYKSKTVVGRTLFASYIAFIIGSFFINALFYPFILILIWTFEGLTPKEKLIS